MFGIATNLARYEGPVGHRFRYDREVTAPNTDQSHISQRADTVRVPHCAPDTIGVGPTGRPPTLIFIHIPKTGGTSLRMALLEAIAPRPSIRLMHYDHSRLVSLTVEERQALAMVEGHMYYGVHELVPGPFRYMTILREPVERVCSWYRYVRSKANHRLHETVVSNCLSLTKCIQQRLTTQLDNHMTRALTSIEFADVPFGGVTEEMLELAKSRLDSIDIVGTTERMEEFYRLLCARLGWPPIAPRHLNRTPVATHEKAVSPVSEDDRDSIAALHRFDAALWDHASVVLSRRLESAGLAPVAGHGGNRA